MTLGQSGIVSIYNPQTQTSIVDKADSTSKIPSTAWVNDWFTNILDTSSLVWALAQTFTIGIRTNSINPITTSGTIQIGNSGTTNIGNIALGATDKVNIAGGTNITGSELFLGSTTLTRAFLRGVDVNINQRVGNINIGADTVASNRLPPMTQNYVSRLHSNITLF